MPQVQVRNVLEKRPSLVVAAPAVLRATAATAVHNFCRSLKMASSTITIGLNTVFHHVMLDVAGAQRPLTRANRPWRI